MEDIKEERNEVVDFEKVTTKESRERNKRLYAYAEGLKKLQERGKEQ